MLDLERITLIILISTSSSIITTATIQKIKNILTSKKHLNIISLFISASIGILFTISFSTLSIFDSIWVGLINWIEADMIYKLFEGKIFTKFSDMNNAISIPVEKQIIMDELDQI